MNFPFYIARRYLFSKKSHNAINIISMVSVCGVVVATIALVCALSVYNGFNDLVSTLFSSFDPELKITPRTGKVFDPQDSQIEKVKKLPSIDVWCEVLEDNALVRYDNRQVVAVVKGVDKSFEQLASIDSVLVDGNFILQDDVVDYAIPGIGMASALGVNAGYLSPMEFYAPKRDEKVNLSNPATSFQVSYAYAGAVFCINQQVYDENYILVPISLTRELFKYETEVSSIEIKLRPSSNFSSDKDEITSILGKDFIVQDRFEQQEASYKMMQIEKWMTFLILSFILAIALFNVVGSLSMLMIEKQEDVKTLRNMGASDSLISRIFLFEGWMIAGFGALIGILIGIILCLIQQEFGLLKLGQTTGAFIVDAYPVRVALSDVITVFITVVTIGFIAAWYPVHHLGKKWFVR
ncbi:FtsX-like permease family protein [Macellibacteroides fermentans]|uniref:Lipoprotein-releasing system permease protein n=1 Tax=Parabacteroides chartae TaxID=1037355 RepID=A0A1T5A4W7_9BACT|nr:FtsX-like permease family protein [Parabacteroides chartae]SKB29945.1 lipoprotein-releasing system permease protein [Parabacteroides chartae]